MAYAIVAFFFLLLLIGNFTQVGEQQFAFLTTAFLHGKLHFLENPGSWTDCVVHEGKYYWPLGPLPAIALMPFSFMFSWFDLFFLQAYLQPFLVCGVFWLVFRFARSFDFSRGDSLFWALGFTFASVFCNVALIPWSWWFSQVLTVLLIWAALWEHCHKRRYWLLGTILGALLLTRVTAVFLGVLFLLGIFWPGKAASVPEDKAKFIGQLSLPLAAAVLLAMAYNYLRFGNFLEQGYSSQAVLNDALETARGYGLFSINHLPGNLYYFLLSTPLPVFKDGVSHVLKPPFIVANPWGMSVFVTSPYLIKLFFYEYRDRFSRQLLIAAIIIAVPIFVYYGIGFRQSGYRYSLDFLPLVYLVLMKKYREENLSLSLAMKFVFVLTALCNVYFLATLFIQV